MSRLTYENYAIRAGSGLNFTEIAGRYDIQAEAERAIPPDVAGKLALDPDDTLLELGCGAGNLLLPLSSMVRTATGIDHPEVIASLQQRLKDEPITTIGGNFLDSGLVLPDCYSCILIYSVLHCLADMTEVFAFLDKALESLEPGGRLLLGDLPNTDRKRRFVESPAGARFQEEWRQLMQESSTAERTPDELADDPQTASFDDEKVLALVLHCRQVGLDAFVLPQPDELPFGHTREDVLVVSPSQ